MRKVLNITAMLFVLTVLAFGLIGCDGSKEQAKVDEMLGTNVKLNGTSITHGAEPRGLAKVNYGRRN